MHRALYAGSFDPITLGHLDIIRRAQKIFDEVIIAVGENNEKKSLFTPEERVELIREALKELPGNKTTEITIFNSLTVDLAKKTNCTILIRGLRALSDFDYEFQLGLLNRKLNDDIETVYLLTDQKHLYLSSGTVKEIVSKNGKVNSMVPICVEKALNNKFSSIKKKEE